MLRLDLIAQQLRENALVDHPIHRSTKQHGHTDDREDVVWIAIRVRAAGRRDEWDDCQERIDEEVDHNDREECLEWGRPVLRWREPEVDETDRDEAVDPCTGVL
jgi:hypothetical protein